MNHLMTKIAGLGENSVLRDPRLAADRRTFTSDPPVLMKDRDSRFWECKGAVSHRISRFYMDPVVRF